MQEIENFQHPQTTSTNGTKKENAKSTPTKAAGTTTTTKTKITPTQRKVEAVSSEDEFVDPKPVPKIDKSTRSTPKKAKLSEPSPAKKDVAPPKKTPTKTTSKTAPKAAAKSTKKIDTNDSDGDLQRKAILESIETVDLPDAAPASDKKYAARRLS